MSLDMYAEELLNNYEHPKNKGKIADADISKHEDNVSCGDELTIYLKLEGGKVKDVKFEGSGCVISMGTASILTDNVKGKTLKELEQMKKEDVLDLIGIDPGPVRLHCATLSLRAIKIGVLEHEKKPLTADVREL